MAPFVVPMLAYVEFFLVLIQVIFRYVGSAANPISPIDIFIPMLIVAIEIEVSGTMRPSWWNLRKGCSVSTEKEVLDELSGDGDSRQT